jgi:hypothetical protein
LIHLEWGVYTAYLILFTSEKAKVIDDIYALFNGAFVNNTIKSHRADFIQHQALCLNINIDSTTTTADVMAQKLTTLPSQKRRPLGEEQTVWVRC